MSQRRAPGEWVLVTLPDTRQPQPALIQPPLHGPEPCFECDDGDCHAWPTSIAKPHGGITIKTISECIMSTVPKSFSPLALERRSPVQPPQSC
jgi:hypothetical protein